MRKIPLPPEIRSTRGFTLIEAIAVLILIGIVAAVAVARGMSSEDVKVRAAINTLKSHLRYAQYLAMNDLAPIKWGLEIGGSSYELVKYDDGTKTSHTHILPGDSSATHSLESGISASGNSPILFDEWGSPGSADLNVTLNGKSINITANTGFIP